MPPPVSLGTAVRALGLDFTPFPPSALPTDRQTDAREGLLPLVHSSGPSQSAAAPLFCCAVVAFYSGLSFLVFGPCFRPSSFLGCL